MVLKNTVYFKNAWVLCHGVTQRGLGQPGEGGFIDPAIPISWPQQLRHLAWPGPGALEARGALVPETAN